MRVFGMLVSALVHVYVLMLIVLVASAVESRGPVRRAAPVRQAQVDLSWVALPASVAAAPTSPMVSGAEQKPVVSGASVPAVAKGPVFHCRCEAGRVLYDVLERSEGLVGFATRDVLTQPLTSFHAFWMPGTSRTSTGPFDVSGTLTLSLTTEAQAAIPSLDRRLDEAAAILGVRVADVVVFAVLPARWAQRLRERVSEYVGASYADIRTVGVIDFDISSDGDIVVIGATRPAKVDP